MTSPNFFTENSPYLQHPLLTAERTAKEVDFIISQLDLPPMARLLDVGCGFGRHSIALARRGYGVVGLDPSAAMIATARAEAELAGVSIDFRQVRGESFTTRQQFEAALCLFTTLGQVSESGENSGLVAQVHQALKPGGRFVVEVPQRETTVRNLKTSEKFGQGDRYTAVTRQFNPDDNTITETFNVVSPTSTRQYLLRYRLYSLAELNSLLDQAGFSVVTTYADYEGTPLDPESPTMLVTSVKPAR